MEVEDVGKEPKSPVTTPMVVAIGASGKKCSKLALKWALDNFTTGERKVVFRIIHIRPPITMVPSPMGMLPLSAVRKDIASAYIDAVESKTSHMLAPYERLCAQKKVESETLVIEADDIVAAISAEVAKCEIGKLVLGSSPRNALSRKFIENDTSTSVMGWDPHFCVVYFVSKGKLSAVHTTSLERTRGPDVTNPSLNSNNSPIYNSPRQTGRSDVGLSREQLSPFAEDQHSKFFSTVSQQSNIGITSAVNVAHPRTPRYRGEEESVPVSYGYAEKRGENSSSGNSQKSSENSGVSHTRSLQTDSSSWPSVQTSTSGTPPDSSLLSSQITDELEKLKLELRHVQEMFKIAQDESVDTSRKVAELSNLKIKEETKLKVVSTKEEQAIEMAKHEKEKREAAEREAAFAKECIEREVTQKKAAEVIAAHEVKEKQKLERSLSYVDHQFEKFEWEEIVSATSSFSDSLQIGEGAYGAVYKCTLRHITVAVKVLKAVEVKKDKQFQRELEILSRIRHPHLLLLIGACPDRGCLVYEYMENGSLEDRLCRRHGTPPLAWYDRFRITWELASALLFLHGSKPRPVVHRDLKPANILLDHNLVSKIGDVGLCTLIPMDNSTIATAYKNTALVGTYCYVDPEYQRTGLVSPKSDLYAFGIVILQLLTAQPPMGLAHFVERAIEEGRLEEILDDTAGKWPMDETLELACLGLRCAEFRCKDRPDLKDEVLPLFLRLKEVAEDAKSTISKAQGPPSHFICPIFQDIMEDPWVAPDGYTYERRAIERWLKTHDTSPMTNLPLPNKNLIPNHTLASAISEWKSSNQLDTTSHSS